MTSPSCESTFWRKFIEWHKFFPVGYITAGELPWMEMDSLFLYIYIYKKHMETWHLFNPYCVQEVFPSQHALFAQHENEFMIYIALFFLFFFFYIYKEQTLRLLRLMGKILFLVALGLTQFAWKRETWEVLPKLK
jgi:hypothetical protein